MRRLELLSPARTAQVGIDAIMHGADAVYIGPEDFGARHAASNPTDEIKRLCDVAHTYRARVYATVNTIIYEHELKNVERLIRELYLAGVDALIVQDLGILRLDIPPIELHASTQCDTRTPEKARFLQDVGFSQIVLARELSLTQIKEISNAVSVPVECFIHGALCVSYSGCCYASQACMGRSANRGECSQMCRLPYTLCDSQTGKVIAHDKYLLSLRDFNASSSLADLIEAGASSFKIEGRLKDSQYVKNVTAYYSQLLDQIVARYPHKYCRASLGRCEIPFIPNPSKSFNRGFTDHFLTTDSRSVQRASTNTPKSQGEIIDDISMLNNGDGIAYTDHNGDFCGARVNSVTNGKVMIVSEGGKRQRELRIAPNTRIHRTFDYRFSREVEGSKGNRKLWYDVTLDATGLTAVDERGCMVRLPLGIIPEPAKTLQDMRRVFEKTSDTPYRLRNFTNTISDKFVPASILTSLRRQLTDALDRAARCSYQFGYRRKEDPAAIAPLKNMDYRGNVVNSKALSFWQSHGVKKIDPALETTTKSASQLTVMTCRYCILGELGMCRKGNNPYMGDLELRTGPHRMLIHTDCSKCEMSLILNKKSC